jgi:hypothetical protein
MEMHIIAYIYHWERDTIRKLGSTERKKWVELIMKQKDAENSQVEGVQ